MVSHPANSRLIAQWIAKNVNVLRDLLFSINMTGIIHPLPGSGSDRENRQTDRHGLLPLSVPFQVNGQMFLPVGFIVIAIKKIPGMGHTGDGQCPFKGAG